VILRARGIRSPTYEFQVSGMNLLHSYRFQILGQGRYGGLYGRFRGFWVEGGPTCVGNSVEGTHECVPIH
jgi:hypothetical protein